MVLPSFRSASIPGPLSEMQLRPALAVLHQSLALSMVPGNPLPVCHSGGVASCQATRCGHHLLLRHASPSAWPCNALPALGLCHQRQLLQLGPELGAKTNLLSSKLAPL